MSGHVQNDSGVFKRLGWGESWAGWAEMRFPHFLDSFQ